MVDRQAPPSNDPSFEVHPDTLIAEAGRELNTTMMNLIAMRAAANTERAQRLAVEAKLSHIIGELPEILRTLNVPDDEIPALIENLVEGGELVGLLTDLAGDLGDAETELLAEIVDANDADKDD